MIPASFAQYRQTRPQLSFFGVSLVAVSLMLAGCADTGTDISSAASQDLQNAVVLVAETAAAGDTAGAVAALDAVQTRLDEGQADNSITAERGASIQSAIDLVRADLTATLENAPSETPTTPEPVATAPAEQTSTTPAPDPIEETPTEENPTEEPPAPVLPGNEDKPDKGDKPEKPDEADDPVVPGKPGQKTETPKVEKGDNAE
jgi:hypothetical protein